MAPMTDPTVIPATALLLRPVVTFVVKVEGEVGVEAVLDSEAVAGDCVDEVLVAGAELLEEEVPGSMTNPGEGILGAPM